MFYLLFISLTVSAQVNFKWLGISNFVLSDGKSSIMFDPAITRPGFLDYLPFRKFKTDEAEVQYWMKRCELSKLDGIFTNHTHFDHAGDASFITKNFGGILYGSSSAMKLGEGQGVKPEQRKQIKAGDEIIIGDFKIKVFNIPHAPHFLNVMLMEGHITEPLPLEASVWDYKVGEALSFLISHPKGSIMFSAIGRVYEDDALKNEKADVLLMTIANRRSSEELLEKRAAPSGAKIVIPLHHDNFFFPMKREGTPDLLWGIKLDEFKEKSKKFNVIYPEYCKTINIF